MMTLPIISRKNYRERSKWRAASRRKCHTDWVRIVFEEALPFTTGPENYLFKKSKQLQKSKACKPKLLSEVLQGNVH